MTKLGQYYQQRRAAIKRSGKREKRDIFIDYTAPYGIPYNTSTATINYQTSMKLSAFYRGVDVKSGAIGSLPIRVEKKDGNNWIPAPEHPLNYILDVEPSNTMTSFTLFKTATALLDLKGNAIIRIHRNDKLEAVELELITNDVTILIDANRILYYAIQYPTGKGTVIVEQSDIIHLMNFTYNGLVGISTIQHAANTLELSVAAENQAAGFFSSGANLSGLIEIEGRIDQERADVVKAAWASAFNTTDGSPNSVGVLEQGMKFTPVQVNPKDAQMLESRQFNIIDLCRFLGVTPVKVFDDTMTSYNTVESMQLAFLTDTISNLVAKIENELRRKLFKPSLKRSFRIRFEIADLLRADLDSQANYYQKMFQVGGFTVNEIRDKTGTPKSDAANADSPFVMVNTQPVDSVNQKVKTDGNIKK